MKNLTNYITEAQKLPNLKVSKIVVPMGACGPDGDEEPGTIPFEQLHTKEIVFPAPVKRFIIYNDKYHGCMHIATLSDMVVSMIFYSDAYEDFGPEDVLASFDTLREAVDWAIEKYGKPDEGFGPDEYDFYGLEDADFYDSTEFLARVLHNKETDEDEELLPELKNADFVNPEKLYKVFQKEYC